MENLRLVKGADDWTIPDDAWISGVPFTVRRKESDRACQHGVIDTGDGKIDSRTVSLTIYIEEDTQSEYFATMDALKKRLYRKDQKLYVTTTRYIVLSSLYSFKEEYITGFVNRKCFVTAEFKCNDPFFYSSTPEVATVAVASSPHTFTVTNIGNVDVPPVIKISASDAVPSVQLTNNTNARLCLYQDPQLIADTVLEIDNGAATVERDRTNTLNAFSGTFHSLESGANVFEYEGVAAVSIEITYTPRWL